ncbi:PREDICTED: uncharacterized protein LOC108751841 isoform X2 [Trachymyrmex septentrionalis]|uniref:uncharacterized protein LOC108751841 isoform X2 n=1 Tax=Trachymyrmex septentrionalis TaxID=34720 RepID=UPI00084EEFD2|nr:PREDICTED: uncharacterized protein LOC108751841 isoform X2 [Trachymyrmex septentrionalis]
MRNGFTDIPVASADSSTDAIWLEKSSPSRMAPERMSLNFEKVVVKQERPDDAEIRELAAKMVEAHKAKMLASMPAVQQQQQRQQCLIPQPNLPGILGYLHKRPTDGSSAPKPPSGGLESKVPTPDDDSQRGRFGWTSFDECHIPYIFRSGEKYCAVRILESKLLNKYLSFLHSDIYSCTCIRSYYITEAESKLFNEINTKHCENQFGRDVFTCKDLVVRLSDAKEFYTFLDVCYTKLTAGTNPNVTSGRKAEKCGFIRINKESVVPYTVKDSLQYVPLFYFEGETENLKLKAEKLEGWDLSYLKFCCKVQGIRNELFASETCSVISLSDIKSYFPPGTGFEDYWPTKVMDSQLLVNSNGSGTGGGWTKQPPTPPATKPPSVQSANKVAPPLNTRTVPMPNMMPRGGTVASTAAQMPRIGQPRPVVTHPAHSSPSGLPTGRSNMPVVSQPMLNTVQGVVNGHWSGLVGGQPTFQTALNPQASIIRATLNNVMHNMTTAPKSYSQQSRSRGSSSGAAAQYPGVYSTTTMQGVAQVQPPPLIRATVHSNQPNLGYPTYGKDDWVTTTYTTPTLGVPNAVTATTYPQMLGLSEQVQALMPVPTSAPNLLHPQRHTPSVHNTSHSKYPPPLIPVNGSSGSGNSSGSRDTRGKKPLIPISDPQHITTCHVQPYQIQKALLEEKMVPCINFKPYIYSELLMTLPDFVSNFFPACDIESCRQVLTDVLHIELYQGNRLQMKMLMEAGKCSSLTEDLPLIHIRSIMKYMPQFKYMFNRGDMVMPSLAHSSEEHPAKKRQRTS